MTLARGCPQSLLGAPPADLVAAAPRSPLLLRTLQGGTALRAPGGTEAHPNSTPPVVVQTQELLMSAPFSASKTNSWAPLGIGIGSTSLHRTTKTHAQAPHECKSVPQKPHLVLLLLMTNGGGDAVHRRPLPHARPTWDDGQPRHTSGSALTALLVEPIHARLIPPRPPLVIAIPLGGVRHGVVRPGLYKRRHRRPHVTPKCRSGGQPLAWPGRFG
eukprot:1175869-Prorocentrum_minimum.AAC.2